MIEVQVYGSNIDSAIKRLRAEVAKDGTLRKFAEREHGYYKPSAARARKRRAAAARLRRRERLRQ